MFKFITKDSLNELSAKACQSPRLRMNSNLHAELADPVQRLCNAMEPGTYVRPHRHPERWEFFSVLSGSILALFFDDEGRVIQRVELSTQGPVLAVEFPANTWHTLTTLESGSVFFEIKQGPYIQPDPSDFAAWAPAEGEPAVSTFHDWFLKAQVGDLPPLML